MSSSVHPVIGSCAICFDDMIAGRQVAHPCGHIFHQACLRDWYARSLTCPECRAHIVDHLVSEKNISTANSELRLTALQIRAYVDTLTFSENERSWWMALAVREVKGHVRLHYDPTYWAGVSRRPPFPTVAAIEAIKSYTDRMYAGAEAASSLVEQAELTMHLVDMHLEELALLAAEYPRIGGRQMTKPGYLRRFINLFKSCIS